MSYLVVLTLVASMIGPVSGGAPISAGVTTDTFTYIWESDTHAAPRFRPIKSGLPLGIAREDLLSGIDPGMVTDWHVGWFTYGDDHSRSVAVALQTKPRLDLFIDLNRDKRLSPHERIEGPTASPTEWRTTLDAEFVSPNRAAQLCPRSIIIRRSTQTGELEIATAGFMRGQVSVGDRQLIAVRLDRDSNGRWFDRQDRIVLDTNSDGILDFIGERLACESVCVVEGKRFAMESDLVGDRLRLTELAGTGSLVARVALQSQSARVLRLAASIVSQGGVRVNVASMDEPLDCPVGMYRIESLELEVVDASTAYWYRFARDDRPDSTFELKPGETVEIDLLGQLKLSATQATIDSDPAAATLIVTPLLTTTSGLYLTGCKTGAQVPNVEQRLQAISFVGTEVFNHGSSGFS